MSLNNSEKQTAISSTNFCENANDYRNSGLINHLNSSSLQTLTRFTIAQKVQEALRFQRTSKIRNCLVPLKMPSKTTNSTLEG